MGESNEVTYKVIPSHRMYLLVSPMKFMRQSSAERICCLSKQCSFEELPKINGFG